MTEHPILRGIYYHFKGGKYYVVDVVEHTETGDRMVVYRKWDGEKMWARPLEMFKEEVEWPDGSERPRFMHVSQLDIDDNPYEE